MISLGDLWISDCIEADVLYHNRFGLTDDSNIMIILDTRQESETPVLVGPDASKRRVIPRNVHRTINGHVDQAHWINIVNIGLVIALIIYPHAWFGLLATLYGYYIQRRTGNEIIQWCRFYKIVYQSGKYVIIPDKRPDRVRRYQYGNRVFLLKGFHYYPRQAKLKPPELVKSFMTENDQT